MGGRIGAGRCHAIRTLSHYTDNMDKVPNEGSAVRCRAFRGLREEGGGAWEADALPTELFPLNDLRGPYLDWGPNRGQRQSYHGVFNGRLLAPIGNIPPVEYEQDYYRIQEAPAAVAELN